MAERDLIRRKLAGVEQQEGLHDLEEFKIVALG